MFITKCAFLLMTTLFHSSNTLTLDKNLVVDFFKIKYVQFGYVFDCISTKERINFAKFLMKNNLRITVHNVTDYNSGFITEKYQYFHHFGIIVNGDCPNVDKLLKEAGESRLFDDVHHWLVITSNGSILTNSFNLNLNINTDLYGAILTTNNYEKMQNWTLIDVYNPAFKHGGELKIEIIGFHNKATGFQIKKKANKFWTRRNMTGVHFKTVTVLRQPYKGTLDEYLERGEDRRADPYSRFHCRLIYYCKEFYNFSLEVNATNTWGYEIERGKFDGMSGALQRKEIDFGCTALYVKPERIPVMDYAIGLWNFSLSLLGKTNILTQLNSAYRQTIAAHNEQVNKNRVTFVFRQPTVRSFGQIFLHPMSNSVWLTTLAAAVLIIITLKLNQKFELRILRNLKNTLDQTWSTVILFALGAFCQQGSPQTPVLLCGRIITISILIFCVLFYQFYSGSIVSSLLTKPPITIKTPNDLLKSPLKVGADSSPYMKDYFRTTKNPVAIALYKEKMLGHGNSSNFYPPEYGLKQVEKGGFAYQVETTTGYIIVGNSFSDKAICELGEVELLTEATIMTVLQKNSPFRDMLNYCIQRLAEHGIGVYEKQHWGARKPECLQSSHSISFHVGLREVYPAIGLLHIGILLSLMILGVEIFMKARNKKKENKKKGALPIVKLFRVHEPEISP